MIFKQIINKHRKTVIFYIALGIITTFLESLGVNIFQKVIDSFTNQTLNIPTVLLYGVIITTVAILWYINNIPNKLGNAFYLDLKIMALRKMSVINYADYQKFGVGKLIQQIENGATAGKNIMFEFYLRIFREHIPNIIISVIFIALININLIKFLLIGYVIIFIVTNIVLKRLYKIKSRILTNEEFLNHYFVRGLMELVVFRTNKRYAAGKKRRMKLFQIKQK